MVDHNFCFVFTLTILFCCSSAEIMGIVFENLNDEPQYISGDWARKDMSRHRDLESLDFVLQPNESAFVRGRTRTSPKLYIGTTPNCRTSEVGDKRNHDTVVEVTFNGAHGHTYFDVDIEKGFSSPVWCYGWNDSWHEGQGCISDILAACPEEDRHYDDESGVYDQCIGTKYNVPMRRQLCPDVYIEPYDRWTKTIGKGHLLRCIIMNPRTQNVFAADPDFSDAKELEKDRDAEEAESLASTQRRAKRLLRGRAKRWLYDPQFLDCECAGVTAYLKPCPMKFCVPDAAPCGEGVYVPPPEDSEEVHGKCIIPEDALPVFDWGEG